MGITYLPCEMINCLEVSIGHGVKNDSLINTSLIISLKIQSLIHLETAGTGTNLTKCYFQCLVYEQQNNTTLYKKLKIIYAPSGTYRACTSTSFFENKPKPTPTLTREKRDSNKSCNWQGEVDFVHPLAPSLPSPMKNMEDSYLLTLVPKGCHEVKVFVLEYSPSWQ